jgi:hypothetical protein
MGGEQGCAGPPRWATGDRLLSIYDPFEQGAWDSMAKFDAPNSLSENKFDVAAGDLFVECHCGQQWFALRGFQHKLRGQAGAREQFPDALNVWGRQTDELRRQAGGSDLADGDSFSMQIFPVTGNSLQCVPDRMAEIQNSPKAALGFILANHVGFDLATPPNDRGERLGITRKHFGKILLEPSEKRSVINDPIFDHLGDARAILTIGKSLKSFEIA